MLSLLNKNMFLGFAPSLLRGGSFVALFVWSSLLVFLVRVNWMTNLNTLFGRTPAGRLREGLISNPR